MLFLCIYQTPLHLFDCKTSNSGFAFHRWGSNVWQLYNLHDKVSHANYWAMDYKINTAFHSRKQECGNVVPICVKEKMSKGIIRWRRNKSSHCTSHRFANQCVTHAISYNHGHSHHLHGEYAFFLTWEYTAVELITNDSRHALNKSVHNSGIYLWAKLSAPSQFSLLSPVQRDEIMKFTL